MKKLKLVVVLVSKVGWSVAFALMLVIAGSGGGAQAQQPGPGPFKLPNGYAAIYHRAERGDALAQAQLGRLYSTGQGVPQDFYEAAKWYYSAATLGQTDAQFALAMLYNKGEGVRRDFILAYMWMNLSASQATGADRDFKTRMRDSIASKMTVEQVQLAQQMAIDWQRPR